LFGQSSELALCRIRRGCGFLRARILATAKQTAKQLSSDFDDRNGVADRTAR
jgi:hypothetical protein